MIINNSTESLIFITFQGSTDVLKYVMTLSTNEVLKVKFFNLCIKLILLFIIENITPVPPKKLAELAK